MAELPVISVVIATFQRETLLRKTIADVLVQEYPRFELLIVDQSETPAAGLDQRAQIIYTRPAHLPRARNIGARAAHGSIIVFVDDDVALPPHFLAAHAACYADDRVGGVAGRVILDVHPSRSWIAPPATGIDFDRAQPGDVPFARGCNMSFQREALFAAGLFDEHLSPIAWGEEEDMCFAVRRLGLSIWFEPRAWLIHQKALQGGMRAGSHVPADRTDFYRDRVYFAMRNLGGLDFCRVLWDTYRHALPPRARGSQILRRQVIWLCGSCNGLVHFIKHGNRLRPLPYRVN